MVGPAGWSGRQLYQRITGRKRLTVAALAVTLLGSVLLDVALGPAGLTLGEVLLGILVPASNDLTRQAIIWDIRLPMALMAVVVGAALAVAGAEMQTILNNPLASPFTLGIAAAASFGAALALVLGLSLLPLAGVFFVAGNAFIFAVLACLVLYGCSLLRGVTAETMVLLGIALVFLFNALLALLQYIASEQASSRSSSGRSAAWPGRTGPSSA